jgi:hypothetical protein
MAKERRPYLEIASWIAGIVSAFLAVYLWLRPPPAGSESTSPVASVPSPTAQKAKPPEVAPHKPPGISAELRALIQGLDKTTYSGTTPDNWPQGGLRNTYYHLSTFVAYKLLADRFGRPVFVSGPHSRSSLDLHSVNSFGHYDPEFPKWLSGQLVEISSDPSLVNSTRPMFEKYLQTQALLYFDAYNYLKLNPKLKTWLQDGYTEGLRKGSLRPGTYSWLDWLSTSGKWETQDVAWMMAGLDEKYGLNRTSSAVYFWIRRSIDGTELGFFECLMKVLLAYSPAVVANVQATSKYEFPGRK